MSKKLVSTLLEDIAQKNLGNANRAFKTIMSEKLLQGLSEHAMKVQNNISEAYPEIFDSPVDVDAASEVPDIEDYPESQDDDEIEPEQGKSEADYAKGEDQDVYEQMVYEGDEEDDLHEVDGDDVPPLDGEEEELEEAGFNAAAAEAAVNDEEEFEFPAGSGNMHPVTMDKDTAHEIVSS